MTATALLTPRRSPSKRSSEFLYREARYLDDREFEKWLHCYADDVEYWMPSWRDDGMLSEDPQTEISLVYYPNKGGLEDRVSRIKTERSSATSLPEARTSHNISNVEVIERRGDRRCAGSTGTPCISATRPSTRTTEPRSTPLTSPGKRR